MLTTVNRQLRRHRRRVLWALALLAVVGVALTTRTALMNAHGHGDISDAVTICITVGACVAIAGAAAFAVRRIVQRGLWLIPARLAPALPFVVAAPGFHIRAGPRLPVLLQVFRL